MIAVIVAVLTAIAAYLFIVLFKKRSVISGILFATVFLLGMLFLFGYRFSFTHRYKSNPPLYFLIDKSISASLNTAENNILDRLKKKNKKDRIYYFADTLSKDSKNLNSQYTAMFDSFITLRRNIEREARVVIVSDFHDNSSFNIPLLDSTNLYSDNIFPIVVGKTIADKVAIHCVKIDDIVQAGDKTSITVDIYSTSQTTAKLTVRQNNKTIITKTVDLNIGINTFRLSHKFYSKGYRQLKFIVGGDSSEKLISVVPDFYKILVVVGRPSVEYAFFKRFLDKLKWIKSDFVLLKRKGQKVYLPSLSKYTGVVLIDIKDNQIENFSDLQKYKKPIFYQTGLRSQWEIKKLVSLFSNMNLKYNLTEKQFIYNDNQFIVSIAFDTTELLCSPQPTRKIFFGWDTWKWDMITLPTGIDNNSYEVFWKNQVNFLISSEDRSFPLDKLNYIVGDTELQSLPLKSTNIGVHSFISNSQWVKIMINNNSRELGVSGANNTIAHLFNSNTVFLHSIEDPDGFIKSVEGNTKIEIKKIVIIDFRRNIIVFILMLVCIIIFWILSDREEIQR